ncbi:MAG: 16S rRNA (cytidine(1402)-2'-O)-methyltransferase [Longimicrobiales bacterium]|nr:16S rRNA (cytidine(1402)-2'-O)-methyltransferase [Longimicrobiales bacterium]
MAILYLVSTPIGNLEDLSERARRILGEVDHVAAEDTRHTGRLLQRLEIDTDLISLHRHNEAERVHLLTQWLDAGEAIALVSDAGTPLVSDPGARLVRAVREAGHTVVPVPGPSAVLAALTASGLPSERFTFLGFLPRKGRDREALLRRVALSRETTILFESPERTVALLGALVAACGADREASVAREMTKRHEEIRTGTLVELLNYYEASGVRGEVTLSVAPADDDARAPDTSEAPAEAARLVAGGMKPSAAAREITRRFGIPRGTAYDIVQEAGRSGDQEE